MELLAIIGVAILAVLLLGWRDQRNHRATERRYLAQLEGRAGISAEEFCKTINVDTSLVELARYIRSRLAASYGCSPEKIYPNDELELMGISYDEDLQAVLEADTEPSPVPLDSLTLEHVSTVGGLVKAAASSESLVSRPISG